MSKTNKNNNNKKQNNNKQTQRNRPRRGTRQPAKGRSTAIERKISPYLDMVLNPCDCELVPGLYGTSEGMLARVKKEFVISNGTTCGYVLWDSTGMCVGYDPAFHGAGRSMGGNLFGWASTDPDLAPLNTDLIPYGHIQVPFSAAAQTASSLSDPAADLLRTSLVEDARTLSSCIKMTYFGTVLESAGRMAYVENLPVETILSGNVNGGPVSVNDLFRYTTNTHRFGLKSYEIVPRPEEKTIRYCGGTPLLTEPNLTGVSNGSLELRAALSTVLTGSQRTIPKRLSGFVWSNLDEKANIVLELTKNVEWRASPNVGLSISPPRNLHPPLQQKMTMIADRVAPGWSTRAYDPESKSKAVISFRGRESHRSVWSMVKKSIPGIVGSALPSELSPIYNALIGAIGF